MYLCKGQRLIFSREDLGVRTFAITSLYGMLAALIGATFAITALA
jgi:hypothetical protein